MYLDDISVVDTASPSVQLLENPSFENSSTTLIDWTVWCGNTCSGGTQGTIVTGGNCLSGNCYRSQCTGTNGVDSLVQIFPAVVGHTYTVSFYFRRQVLWFGSTVILYVGIA
jgi:hypothetical protein